MWHSLSVAEGTGPAKMKLFPSALSLTAAELSQTPAVPHPLRPAGQRLASSAGQIDYRSFVSHFPSSSFHLSARPAFTSRFGVACIRTSLALHGAFLLFEFKLRQEEIEFLPRGRIQYRSLAGAQIVIVGEYKL